MFVFTILNSKPTVQFVFDINQLNRIFRTNYIFVVVIIFCFLESDFDRLIRHCRLFDLLYPQKKFLVKLNLATKMKYRQLALLRFRFS